ncbi:MAG: sulfatase-like hydrolase/transferase [bacterium]|nr:sulfatase-like hydrolase/transferase [bacterium]
MSAARSIASALALLAAGAGASCAAIEPEPEAPPNVILIMLDDVGVEAFADWGGTSYATPHIDALAAGGVRFTACHSQPLCTPTRVQIMTGRSNVRNYVRFGILDPSERTFAHELRGAGYQTAVVGKWQLYGNNRDGEHAGTGTHPLDAGFDEYCMWQIDRLGSRYWHPLIDRNGFVIRGGPSVYGPDVFCNYALEFIQANADNPFFLYYPMALVHAPFVPTPDSPDRRSGNKQENFAGMMAYVDDIVGRIVARLELCGARERTLILFTSDNGTDRPIRSETTSGRVRGGKGSTTDRGTHVPLIASWPGTAPAGVVCDDLVDTTDFLPTLLEVAGVEAPRAPLARALTASSSPAGAPNRAFDGHSFLPQVRGQRGQPREWIHCYYNPRPGNARFPEQRFVRTKNHKLYGDGRLFDLRTDPLEKTPLDPDAAPRERAHLESVLASYPSSGVRLRSD